MKAYKSAGTRFGYSATLADAPRLSEGLYRTVATPDAEGTLDTMSEMITPSGDSSCDMSSWLLTHKFGTDEKATRPKRGQNLWHTTRVALLGLLTLGVIGLVIAGRIRRTK